MTADLVARLESAADECAKDAPLLREAASALRSSGEAVAWAQVEEGEVVGLAFKRSTAGDCIEPLYLHPATVTDEDVERAARAYWNAGNRGFSPSWDEMAKGDAGWAASVNVCMRTALESFVRKQPAASAALERV